MQAISQEISESSSLGAWNLFGSHIPLPFNYLPAEAGTALCAKVIQKNNHQNAEDLEKGVIDGNELGGIRWRGMSTLFLPDLFDYGFVFP